MAENLILFPMANPVPEIMPDLAKAAGAAIIGTGRSDFSEPDQQCTCIPGYFPRGALDAYASDINDEMKIAAAYAIAGLITESELEPDYVIPHRLTNVLRRQLQSCCTGRQRFRRKPHPIKHDKKAGGNHFSPAFFCFILKRIKKDVTRAFFIV